MKFYVSLLMILTMTLQAQFAFGAGRLQDADFKTQSQIEAAGGTKAQLLNDTKIYVSGNGINDTLANAVINGQIGGGGGGAGINLLTSALNADFETGALTPWVASAPATVQIVNAASIATTPALAPYLLFGKGSLAFTATAAGQTVRSALVTVPIGLANSACMGQIYYKGGDANYVLKVLNAAGDLMAQRTLSTSADSKTPFQVPMNCGAAGSQYRLSLESTAAGALVAFDRNHIGEQGLSQLAQASIVGAVNFATQTGCSWSFTNAAPYAAGYAVASGCAAPVPFGIAAAPTTSIPGIRFPTLAPGDYELTVEGFELYITSLTTDTSCYVGATDGTNRSGFVSAARQGNSSQAASGTHVIGHFSYANQQSNLTFSLQGYRGGGNGTCVIGSDSASAFPQGLRFTLKRFPTGNDLAVTPQTSAWKIDVFTNTPTGFNLGTAVVNTFSDMQGADGILEVRSTNSLPVGIACASGNASTIGGTTCPSSNEVMGITFQPPRAGDFKVCAQFVSSFDINNNSDASRDYMLFETPSNTTVSPDIGGFGVSHRFTNYATASSQNETIPVRVCRNVSGPVSAQRTIRLKYRQPAIVGQVTSSIIGAVSWEVTPLTENVPMPVMVGPFAQMPTAAVTSSTYTLAPSDAIVDFDTTANAITATLPTAVGARGKSIVLSKKNSGPFGVTVNALAGQFISGRSSTLLLTNPDTIEVYSDGANWNMKDAERTIRFAFNGGNMGQACTTGTCSMARTDGGVNSVLRANVGIYDPQIPGALFSNTPECTCSSTQAGVNVSTCGAIDGGFRLITRSATSGANVDSLGQVICRGPR